MSDVPKAHPRAGRGGALLRADALGSPRRAAATAAARAGGGHGRRRQDDPGRLPRTSL